MGASELAATCADHFSSPARGLQVAKIADGSGILQASAICSEDDFCASTMGSLHVAEIADSSVVSQVYENCGEEGGLLQLPSMVGTIGQPKNTNLGSLHTAATSENLVSQSARSWQAAKVADNSATFPVSANCNDGEGLQQLPSTVGTAEQRENATTSASEQAATFANLDSSSRRSLQVTEIATQQC